MSLELEALSLEPYTMRAITERGYTFLSSLIFVSYIVTNFQPPSGSNNSLAQAGIDPCHLHLRVIKGSTSYN